MADTATPAQKLAEIYDLAGAQEWERVAELVHPDYEIHEAECLPFGGTWKGRDALKRVAQAMYSTWEKASVERHEIVGGAQWAVNILSLTMTSKKTGETFKQTVCEAGRFEDGMLREHRIHYFDAAQVAAQA